MMAKLLLGAGVMALAAGSSSAADRGLASRSLHLDALGSIEAQSLHLDALDVASRSLHLDALSLHLDALGNSFAPASLHLDALEVAPQSLHLDALSLHLDALSFRPGSLHLDALGMGARSLHLDALGIAPQSLHLDALSLHLDALSGNAAMLNGEADLFWGTFEPDSLHLDALDLAPQSLHLDALSLHLDALAQFDTSSLHLDALSLHLDALAQFDPESLHLDALNIHLDALDGLSPASLHLDALSLHLDALSLHLDALGAIEGLSLHLDALSLHLDALAALEELSLHLDALSLHLDALSFDELSLHLDALASLGELSLHLDALSLHLDALDLDTLSLHLDALQYEELSLHLDALGGLRELSLHLDALGQAAESIGQAYGAYDGLLSGVESAFGALVEEQTGQSFTDGFLAGFLDKHGLRGDGFADFLRMSEGERNAFLIDLSDQLTTFLGIDHPDHWMPAVNWSPRLSEIAGYGGGVTVGVVDQGFAGAGALAEAPASYGPVHAGQDHGLAVSGVVAGALDSRGVMGVAPQADMVLANPFAADGQAEIEDVTRAIARVGARGASIINLSLGESGYTFSEGWVDAFGDARVKALTSDSLFVMAAGNDGVVQPGDVDMGSLDAVDRIMLVGATGLDGGIAGFSNTPGDACFIVEGSCTPMAERFLVAPGQQILVATPDGVGRTSGTSFAAPMVSGAAALLQSRWGWLADRPEATAEILFRSATDLGEVGVDGTYGWGLLNVEASQRPLELGALEFWGEGGPVNLVGTGLTPDLLARVDATATLTVFESIGATYRDFEIPVGVLEAGAFDPSIGLEQAVEAYFGERLGTPVGATQSVAGLSFHGTNGFTDAGPQGSVVLGSDRSGWTMHLEARQPAHGLAVPAGGLAFETHGRLLARDSGLSLAFGQGDGALAFGGDSFAMTTDHDIATGGVNPLLGLASGGGYLRAALPLGERFTLSGGISTRNTADLVIDPFSGALTERVAGTDGYRASAATAAISYGLGRETRVTVGLTALNEEEGFLGGQSVGALGFGETAASRAVTFGTESSFGDGFTFAFSGTVGATTGQGGGGGLLAVGDEGVMTTAYQAVLGKSGVFGKADRLRLSLAQPLTVERGRLEVRSLDVIDRTTGELGLVADDIALVSGARRYVGEVLYGRPVMTGRGQVSVFAQFDSAPLLTPEDSAATAGLRFGINF